jgi:hypothetical protein
VGAARKSILAQESNMDYMRRIKEEDATVEWKMLLDQLQAAEAAAGGVPA